MVGVKARSNLMLLRTVNTYKEHLSRHLSLTTSNGIKNEEFPRRVVVTGLGAITPLALGWRDTWNRLNNRVSGLRSLTLDDLKLKHLVMEDMQEIFNQIPSKVVASVPEYCKKEIQEASLSKVSPFVSYSLLAAKEALEDAGWKPSFEEEREKTGVSIGGGIGCISEILDASQLLLNKKIRKISPFFIPQILVNMAAGHVSMAHGLKGPNHATVTACASGAHAIGDAYRMIQFGDAEVMVAGGSEASVDALSLAGFCRAKALSTNFNDNPEEASRPFDRERDGFVMGEGAGVIVLEELEHAKKRGARIYAEVGGYGMSGDAHHITKPPDDGRGAVLAMQRALKQSGLRVSDIDHINAHATSTPSGDAIEALAIATVFQEHALNGKIALSATKGATGHLLGAAGAIEAIFTILAIHNNLAPPTLNLTNPDPIFTRAYAPSNVAIEKEIRNAICNSFGFGGTNACLLFKSPP